MKKLFYKIKKDSSFKKIFFITVVSILWIFGVIVSNKSINGNLFASVTRLNARITKSTCNDTDGGINYWDKWVITVVENGHTRTETDSCNSNWTL